MFRKRIKYFIIVSIVCFVLFGILGYHDAIHSNDGILFASDSRIIVETQTSGNNESALNLERPLSKLESFVVADSTIEQTISDLKSEGIDISENELKQSVALEYADNSVKISVMSTNPGEAQQMCQSLTDNSLHLMQDYYEKVTQVNTAGNAYECTAIMIDNNYHYTISRQSKTMITKPFMIKRILLFGILGLVIALAGTAFIILIIEYKKRIQRHA